MISLQKYFGSGIVKNGISSSGWLQERLIQPFTEKISSLVGENGFDNFFKASSLEQQKEHFQKISAGLEEAVLLVEEIKWQFKSSS